MENISKAKLKWCKSLQSKKQRDSFDVFVVEGEKMVFEGLDIIEKQLQLIVVSESVIDQIPTNFHSKTVVASTKEMSEISSLTTPSSYLAVFKRLEITTTSKFTLALDDIQDPGNLGTLIRVADWFGYDEIVCSKDTVDCYNPKVIQATMGSLFRVKVQYIDLDDYLKNTSRPIFGALLEGKNYTEVDYIENGILLLGNEGKGIKQGNIDSITHPITIPRYGKAESLNVAMAGGILLAEIKKSTR